MTISQVVTRQEYRTMRAYGVGGLVGQDAMTCLSLARARALYAERDDVELTWEQEQESYESVFGEPAAEGAEYLCGVVRIGGRVMASLGFVDFDGSRQARQYLRIVENELLAEAFAAEQDQQRTADQRACFC